jgi:nucleoid DNA-binding protein
MLIEKYIQQLLHQHDCVVIPDFGGFITKYAPATVHPARHSFVPPSKQIAFNEMLRLNDGLLVSHIAVGESVSRDKATQLVREFAEHVRSQVTNNHKYTFEEIGTLSQNPEGKMEFAPASSVNYLAAGFGLPEFSFPPIERRTYTAAKPRVKDRQPMPRHEDFPATVPARRSRQVWVALGFSALVALSTYFVLTSDSEQALGSFNPISALFGKNAGQTANESKAEEKIVVRGEEKAETTPAPAVEKPVEPVNVDEWTVKAEPPAESTKPAVVKTPVAKTESKAEPKAVAPEKAMRYYVIVNGFSVENNATRFRRQLVKEGNSGAKMLPRGTNNLLKVSVADFASRADAEAKAEEMKKQYPAAWVFEN